MSQKISYWLVAASLILLLPLSVLAADLEVDIVDNTGKSIKDPIVSFPASDYSFTSQTVNTILGNPAGTGQVLFIRSHKKYSSWEISLAATNGPQALWTDSLGNFYDFNDPSGPIDGADSDTYGGQMSWLGGGTISSITGESQCPSSDITIQEPASFAEGSTDSLSIMTFAGNNNKHCEWNYSAITDNISQVIPARQPTGTYTLDITLTIL